MTDKPNWLPNLVGGVSIWKLAQDLNQDRLLGGRLLVPETEGSESLPARVTWDLHGLVPLKEARTRFPAEADAATKDFVESLDRVAKEFADPKSGYHAFKDALTFPTLEGDAEHYYFDPATKALKAINWGASPREIAGSQKLVFGYEDWGALRKAAAAAAVGAAVGGAAVAAASAAGDAKPEDKKDEKKDEDKKKEAAAALLLWGRPWWHWLLGLLVAIGILLLILWLLRGCDSKDAGADAEAGPDAPPDVGAILVEPDGAVMIVTADGGLEPFDGAPDAIPGSAGADAGADAAADAGADGDAGAGADAGGGGGGGDDPGGGGGGGSGGGGSGGGGSGGGGSGGGGSGGGGGGGGGDPGGGGGGSEKLLPHRTHFHPDATKWRVTQGANLLHEGSQPTASGNTYDLTLKRGSSFQSVHVQWQDKSGTWHDF